MNRPVWFMKAVVLQLAQTCLPSGVSTIVSEHITTRFGALDSRLAKAVRHALDVAVTFTALTRLNDVHLRITAMAGIVDAHLPIGEPPSHNWREFMVDIFGRNSVGTQRSPVGLDTNHPNAVSRGHLDFAASYRLSGRERATVHDLVAAAGAFVVAEATSLAEFLDDHEMTCGGSHLVDDMIATLQHAGQLGVRLAEVAAGEAWATLLTTPLMADVPEPAPRSVELVPRTGSKDLAHNRDRVVLMVDPMTRTCQRKLTRHALVTLGESMARRGDSALPTLVVMSTVSSVRPVPVDLVMDNKAERRPPFSDSEEWFTRTLDRVSQAVETFNHTGPRQSIADFAEERERPFESLQTAVQDYQPLMLIFLANSATIDFSDRYLDRRRNTPLARPAATESFNGVSVAVISFSPPEVGLRSLVRAWSAAGASEIQYRCLGPGDSDDCAEDYLAEASYVIQQGSPRLDNLPAVRCPPRSVRLGAVAVGALLVAATILTVVITIIWGINAPSNIFGLAIGLFSGALLALPSRWWRRGSRSVRRAAARGG